MWRYALLSGLLFIGFVKMKLDDWNNLVENVRQLQREVGVLKAENKEMRKNTKMLGRITRKEVTKLKAENKAMRGERQIQAESLFLATIRAETIVIQHEDPNVWDYAPVNPGGHYNTTSGMYTVPVNGYYQFYARVRQYENKHLVSFFFTVDGVRHAWARTIFLNPHVDAATINLELTAGQMVSVESNAQTDVYGTDSAGYMQSWFTGYLICVL